MSNCLSLVCSDKHKTSCGWSDCHWFRSYTDINKSMWATLDDDMVMVISVSLSLNLKGKKATIPKQVPVTLHLQTEFHILQQPDNFSHQRSPLSLRSIGAADHNQLYTVWHWTCCYLHPRTGGLSLFAAVSSDEAELWEQWDRMRPNSSDSAMYSLLTSTTCPCGRQWPIHAAWQCRWQSFIILSQLCPSVPGPSLLWCWKASSIISLPPVPEPVWVKVEADFLLKSQAEDRSVRSLLICLLHYEPWG